MRSRAHTGSLRARPTSSRALSSNVPDSTSSHMAHSTILNIVVYVASVVCVRMPEWNRSSGFDSPVGLTSLRDNFTPLMHVFHIKTGFLGRGLRIPAGRSFWFWRPRAPMPAMAGCPGPEQATNGGRIPTDPPWAAGGGKTQNRQRMPGAAVRHTPGKDLPISQGSALGKQRRPMTARVMHISGRYRELGCPFAGTLANAALDLSTFLLSVNPDVFTLPLDLAEVRAESCSSGKL